MLLGCSDQRRSVSANVAASPGVMIVPQRCSRIRRPISNFGVADQERASLFSAAKCEDEAAI